MCVFSFRNLGERAHHCGFGKNRNAQVHLEANDTLQVQLTQNGGTGYSWSVGGIGAPLKFTGETIKKTGAGGMVGAPELHTYNFKPTKGGGGNLTLRHWSPAQGQVGFLPFYVTVDNAGAKQNKTITLSQSDNNRSVALHVGDSILVKLPAPGNRPRYRGWSFIEPEGVVESIGSEFKWQKVSGNYGVQILQFRVVKAGRANLSFFIASNDEKMYASNQVDISIIAVKSGQSFNGSVVQAKK